MSAAKFGKKRINVFKTLIMFIKYLFFPLFIYIHTVNTLSLYIVPPEINTKNIFRVAAKWGQVKRC
jgi:hypothetical protein